MERVYHRTNSKSWVQWYTPPSRYLACQILKKGESMSEAFREAMRLEGIHCQDEIIEDNQVHRFKNKGQGNNKDCWYVFHGDVAVFGDWHVSGYHKWHSERFLTFSAEKKNQYIQRLNSVPPAVPLQKDRETAEIAEEVAQFWQTLDESGNSNYLSRKKVKAYDVRFGENFIAVPLRDETGKIWSLQKIYEDGNKRFVAGGRKKGLFHTLGTLKNGENIYITEGYATAATAYEIMRTTTVVAFDAGNLESVVETIVHKYPRSLISILADDDVFSEKNIGREKATFVSQKWNCRLIFPAFRDLTTKPTDFNDLMLIEGKEAVKDQLSALDKTIVAEVTGDILFDSILTKKEMMFSPFMPDQSLVMLYAPRGLGKTYLSLSIACAVACGKNLMNDAWKTTETHKVYYLDGEMPLFTLQERFKAIVKGLGKDAIDHLRNIRFMNPDIDIHFSIPNLATLEGQKIIEDNLKDTKLLIIDNLSALVRGGKENESESWTCVQDWFLKLRMMGICVLFVHHSNKTGGQRGTSKREDLVDTVIALKKPKDYLMSDGARFEIHYEKARGFYGEESKPFEVQLHNENGVAFWEVKNMENARDLQVIKMHQEGYSYREIAAKLEIGQGTVGRIIKKAKEEGKI